MGHVIARDSHILAYLRTPDRRGTLVGFETLMADLHLTWAELRTSLARLYRSGKIGVTTGAPRQVTAR